MNKISKDKILLAHGGGGLLSDQLIRQKILPKLGSIRKDLPDSASIKLDSRDILFTTDSYVVKPLFFKGGDIGKLAVCGTINDLAVAGAKPVAMSLALIIETGLEMDVLERVLDSIGAAAKENDVEIVTGDTKTVNAGDADQLFINTAGIGVKIPGANLGFDKIQQGDKIILSGTIGDHGMTVMSQRKDISFQSSLKSDCAALSGLTEKLLEKPEHMKFMRDPTRGGLAATLNEIAEHTRLNIQIRQDDIPVLPDVQAAADMLGFDVLNIANEGKFVAVVAEEQAQNYLDICKNHSLGKNAAIIGTVGQPADNPIVELVTKIGGIRIVQMPYGRELPRIC